MTIWIEVTRDEYELPVRVADSATELAEMAGVSANNVYSTVSHYQHRTQKTARFHKVEIEEDDE